MLAVLVRPNDPPLFALEPTVLLNPLAGPTQISLFILMRKQR
jgi:hypothetical protein